MVTEKAQLIGEVKSLLAYHQAIGIDYYPRNQDIDTFCRWDVPTRPISGRKNGRQDPPVARKMTANKEEKQKTADRGSLSEIKLEVASCKACDLYKQRIYPVAGRGGEEVRLLIVGDWLSGDAEGNLLKDRVLGVEQDQMLFRMLAAIKLAPEEVFITNVIKCAVPARCHPAAVHVRCCMSFLRRQIAALAPEIICTMGMVAAKAVLDRPLSLSQLRGKFHDYEVEDGKSVSVITTYHPTYLLQNPEMKKATWSDLQMLAKRLGSARF